jgi:hypothetical protein
MQIALTNHQRPISVRVHGMVDYAYGLLFVLSPWIFQFSGEAAPMGIAVAMGTMRLLWSVITAYPLGLVPLLPFRAHLWLDVISGLMLTISPFVLPMSVQARLVIVVFGVIALLVPMLTKRPHPNLPS